MNSVNKITASVENWQRSLYGNAEIESENGRQRYGSRVRTEARTQVRHAPYRWVTRAVWPLWRTAIVVVAVVIAAVVRIAVVTRVGLVGRFMVGFGRSSRISRWAILRTVEEVGTARISSRTCCARTSPVVRLGRFPRVSRLPWIAWLSGISRFPSVVARVAFRFVLVSAVSVVLGGLCGRQRFERSSQQGGGYQYGCENS